MSRNFGLPYMGSKNRIAKELITEIIWNEPNAQIFIDLFAGGCAISHSAILSGKFKKVIANDINAMPKLFKDAILGKYRDEKRWISRDKFHKLKDTDMYIKSVWSFGNDGETYLYGEHLEPYKKAYHYARVLGDFSLFNQFAPYIEQENGGNLRQYIKTNHERIKKDYSKWLSTDIKYSSSSLQRLQSLQSLERLERLERLESLQSLENLSDTLEISQGSYQEFKLPKADECVIYCDIPYKGTQGYKHNGKKLEFNYEAFYNWVRDKAKDGYKIYISEYQMPSDFKEVLAIDTNSRLNDKSPKKVKEKLFKYEN